MERTTRLLAILIAGLLVSGLGGAYLQHVAPAAAADDPGLLAAIGQSPTVRAGETFEPVAVPTTAAAPVTVARPRVQRTGGPIRPPSQPHARVAVVQIGTIEIPKIGLVHPVYEGIELTVIDQGPGHWPGTALPGQNGNAVFAGHRVTHTHPFLHIDQLTPGDQVIFTIDGVRTAYVMTSSEVVTPKDLRIVNQTAEPTATIFGCHPPHSAKYRYVVHLALAG